MTDTTDIKIMRSIEIEQAPSIEEQPISLAEYRQALHLKERLTQAFREYAELMGIANAEQYEFYQMDEHETEFRWEYCYDDFETQEFPIAFLFDRDNWETKNAEKIEKGRARSAELRQQAEQKRREQERREAERKAKEETQRREEVERKERFRKWQEEARLAKEAEQARREAAVEASMKTEKGIQLAELIARHPELAQSLAKEAQ